LKGFNSFPRVSSVSNGCEGRLLKGSVVLVWGSDELGATCSWSPVSSTGSTTVFFGDAVVPFFLVNVLASSSEVQIAVRSGLLQFCSLQPIAGAKDQAFV